MREFCCHESETGVAGQPAIPVPIPLRQEHFHSPVFDFAGMHSFLLTSAISGFCLCRRKVVQKTDSSVRRIHKSDESIIRKEIELRANENLGHESVPGNSMQRTRTGRIAGFFCGLVTVLFLISAAVTATVCFRPLYYADIGPMHLEEASGLTKEQIRRNYDALIDYNMVWNRDELVFPDLPMSEEGAVHFREVKQIFDGLQILFGITAVLLLSILIGGRKGDRWWLRIAGWTAVALPFVLGVLAMAGWEHFFVMFHQLVFANDYWLFDPVTDPVILILPDTYFLQCAVMIFVLVLAGGVICLLAGRRRGTEERQRRKP